MIRTLRWIAASSMVLAGCSSSDGENPSSSKWTIFVYGNADNNLVDSFANDMGKMSTATLAPGINVIVMADWDSSADIPNAGKRIVTSRSSKYPEGTQWYRISGGGAAPELFDTAPEQDLDDPATLTAAIQKAFTQYPADRRAVILWDHGGGWRGYGGDEQDGTLRCRNPDGSDCPKIMPMEATAHAIDQAAQSLGMAGPRPLEFLTFDTCLMGGAETALAFRTLSKVYIANAELDFGEGLNYKDMLTTIASNQSIDIKDFARTEVDGWDKLHVQKGLADVAFRAHIAIDTGKLDPFAASFTSLVNRLLAGSSDVQKSAIAASFRALPSYTNVLDRGHLRETRDIGLFLAELSESQDATISASAKDAVTALKAMTINVSLGNARSSVQQAGLSLAMPAVSQINEMLPVPPGLTWIADYTNRTKIWNDATKYGDLLQRFVQLNDGKAPVFDVQANNDVDPTPAALPTATILPTSNDIGEATTLLVRPTADGKNLIPLVTVAQQLVKAGGATKATWNGLIYNLGNQSLFVEPFLGKTLRAPGQCVLEQGGEVDQCELLFVDGEANPLAVALKAGGQAPSIALLADFAGYYPNATFAPRIIQIDPSNGTENPSFGNAVPFGANGQITITITRTGAPAGTYGLLVSATSIFGTLARKYVAVTLSRPFGAAGTIAMR